jgi:hypothetical protein
MLPLIIGGIASLAGGYFQAREQRKQAEEQNRINEANRIRQLAEDEAAQRAAYNMGRPAYERLAASNAVRGSVGGQLLGEYFKNLDPNLLSQISTPTAYPNFEFQPGGRAAAPHVPVPGWGGTAGNMLSGIAPYIGMNSIGTNPATAFQQYLAQHPDFAASQRGETYGPPAPTVGGISPEEQEWRNS